MLSRTIHEALRMHNLKYLLTLALLLAAPWAGAASATHVSICADPDPPPWTYWVRDAKNQRTKVFVGTSVDTLRAAFRKIGKTVEFNGDYPWARCVLMVEQGKIDFAMDGYFDDERAKRFSYSTHYSTLTPQVYFLARKPVAVNSLADLKRHKGCGLIGASYAHYGLASTELDLSTGYDSLFRKLKAGRCEYFVEELEVISGYRIIGIDYLGDPEIGHAPVPQAKGPAKHVFAAKGSEAAKLLPELDKAIAELIKSGQAAAIWKKHAPAFTFRP